MNGEEIAGVCLCNSYMPEDLDLGHATEWKAGMHSRREPITYELVAREGVDLTIRSLESQGAVLGR